MRSPHTPLSIILALFTLSLDSSLTLQAQASKPLVEAVEVMGNRRMSRDDILQHVKTRPGQVYSSQQIQDDLQAVLALGSFSKEQTRVLTEQGVRGGIVVMFEVMELPIIKEVRFSGLKNIRVSEITRLWRNVKINIEKGSVYNPLEIKKGMRVIKEYLEAHHWSQVNVTASEYIGEKPDEVSLTFLIEGEDYAIIDVAHYKGINRTRHRASLSSRNSLARRLY